jgi:ribosomal protein L11 methyltransferase
VAAYLELSFALGPLDPQVAEDAGFACGACAVTFVDARDDPVLEPAPGELRLWPQTRVKCLFAPGQPDAELAGALAASLGIEAHRIEAQQIADRAWEREWLKDFHAMRFGRRLWVCPRHERVSAPDAVLVRLDPGLAFGTGTHPSTALCLEWLDTHYSGSPASAEHSEATGSQGLDTHYSGLPVPAEHSVDTRAQGLDTHYSGSSPSAGRCVIDYGCGSGVLAIAAARLGAAEVHAFDIDPQALIATRDNARGNGVAQRLRVHSSPATLPAQADVLLANILAAPLCELAARFAALVRPNGQVVLAGLMEAEAADVTAAYAACFDVARAGDRDGWVCLAGRRH